MATGELALAYRVEGGQSLSTVSRRSASAANTVERATSTVVPEPILHRVAAGDGDATRECLTRYGGLVWSLARRMFNDRAEAEDAVQEVFIQLWRKADQFDPDKASESTFVGVLARRRLIDLLRRKQTRGAEVTADVFEVAHVETDQLEQQDERAQLSHCWSHLTGDQQSVLSRSIYDGRSYSQIAELLSIPVGTVKTRARLGLKSLRDCFTRKQQTLAGEGVTR